MCPPRRGQRRRVTLETLGDSFRPELSQEPTFKRPVYEHGKIRDSSERLEVQLERMGPIFSSAGVTVGCGLYFGLARPIDVSANGSWGIVFGPQVL